MCDLLRSLEAREKLERPEAFDLDEALAYGVALDPTWRDGVYSAVGPGIRYRSIVTRRRRASTGAPQPWSPGSARSQGASPSLRTRTQVQEVPMRGFECVPPDDAHTETMHLEAEDDEGLLGKAKEHVAQYHAALGLTEDQLRGLISQGAYDVQPASV